MYFAMDEIGIDNKNILKQFKSPDEKWDFLYKVASICGFEGVQFTPSLYEDEYQLSLKDIPEYFKKFRLSFHLGSWYASSDEEVNSFDIRMADCFKCAIKYGMEDVSFHPPYIDERVENSRSKCREGLQGIIEKWLPEFYNKGITLSLETHVTGKHFVFNGLEEYYNFIKNYTELGVLIDVSHNLYDGYSEDYILKAIDNLKVTGLHLSDAIPNIDFREGTHLPIGYGNADFKKIVSHYKDYPNIYAALEIKSNYVYIAESLNILKQMVMML